MLPIRAIAQTVVGFIRGLKGRLELWSLIYPIEGLTRLWHHLNPRVYSERLRIRQISEGQIERRGNRFVLFVFYGRETIPAFTQTVIDAIGRRGLNLVISTNAKISPKLRADLLEKCCLLIERADLGRDFGGYKDGISIIEKRFGTPDRLILLNDSLFFFEQGIDTLVASLDGDDDLIGMCEDLHLYYHIQSFALSFGLRVLTNKTWREYWRRFRPISTRRWAIGKGERNLTRQLMRAGFKPTILYSASALVPHLRNCELTEFFDVIRLLPIMARLPFWGQLQQLRSARTLAPLPVLTSLSQSIRRLQRVEAPGARDLHRANVQEILTISNRSLVVHKQHDEWATESLGERMVAYVADRNQIHVGGFFFMKYLGLPVMKRDIFFRELYSLEEIDEYLKDLPAELREEVLADLRQKGTAKLLAGLSKILYRHGSI